nr:MULTISPECIES: acyl-CoA dehydrogenase family protein [unclassified Variovorax]
MADQGWLKFGMPSEYGGYPGAAVQQLILSEEMNYAGAPCNAHSIGAYMVAPAIARFGTAAQKARWMPQLMRAEVTFCLGYSESCAGSDLAAIRTSARRKGDCWVIRGEKLWTTAADKADYVWLAALTDPQAVPRHAGISVFAVPMSSEGISYRASSNLNGTQFYTVTYDDVHVTSDALVGEAGKGWAVIGQALAAERAVFGGTVGRACRVFDEMACQLHAARGGQFDASTQDVMGTLAAEIELARQLSLGTIEALQAGNSGLVPAAMSKISASQLLQRIGVKAVELLGPNALLDIDTGDALIHGGAQDLIRQGIMFSIAGGTNEIQRGIIAVRGLSLPAGLTAAK